MSIIIDQLSKRFGEFTVLDGISLDIADGELVALLGPSGCGKTTLLRIIAGLEPPTSGRLLLAGQDAVKQHVRERQVGFVFQHYALFQHMTVFENVAFGLRVKRRAQRPPSAEIHKRVHELLKLVQLDWLADRYPGQLSGGQRQRIALARALAVEPKVLLLDEPFGALDTQVRKELRRWLRRLHDEIHVTSVFVTHDQEEALEVADRIVVMNRGRIEQIGTPSEVYESPATPFVYQFLGNVNLFHSRVHAGWAQVGSLYVPTPEYRGARQAPGLAYVRPHEIDLLRQPEGHRTLPATVSQVRPIGSMVRLELAWHGEPDVIQVELLKERYAQDPFQVGEKVFIKPRRWRVFLEEEVKEPAANAETDGATPPTARQSSQ